MNNRKLSKNEVIDIVMSEIEYQNLLWDKTLSDGKDGNGYRTIDEYALYILGYANDLLHVASHSANPDEKLNIIRKITALGCQCMSWHGAKRRE